LRFPGFTDEWKKTTLGEITTNFNLRNKEQIDYPMFSVTNNRGFIPQSEQFEDREMKGEDIKAYKVIHHNDFAYNPARINVGSIAKYNGYEPCMISSLYVCFKANNEVNEDWLMHLLRTPKVQYYYQLNGEGGVRIYLFYPNFARIRTSIPSIEEQKKIAKILSIIDERIATQNKIIDNLQSLIKGLNDSFHDNKQGEAISFVELGHSYSGLSGKSGDDFGQGSPYITYLNVFQNNIVDEEQVGLVTIDENESQNTVSYGDVLFTLSSETPEETGIGCVYLGQSGKYHLNSFCFGVRITQSNKVYPPYLAHLVSSSQFRRFVYPLAQGCTRFNLQKNDFMKKKFLLLPIEKQKEISKNLDTLHNKLSVECKLLDLYSTQKAHLLRCLFI